LEGILEKDEGGDPFPTAEQEILMRDTGNAEF